jgi:hypothetical protein
MGLRITDLRILRVTLLASAFSATGCLGPTAVQFTRSRYNEVLQRSNKEEILLNLVRLRYLEALGFLPVTGLTAQFEANSGALGRFGIDRGAPSNYGESSMRFADRPTITFGPQRSPELTKGLLTRIPIDTLAMFVDNGTDQSRLLRLFVRSINGIDNAGVGGGPAPVHAPDFAEFRHVADLTGYLFRERLAVLTRESRQVDVPGTVPFDAVKPDELIKIAGAGEGVRTLGENKGYMLTRSKSFEVLRFQKEALSSPEVVEFARVLGLDPLQETYDVEEIIEGQLRPVLYQQPRNKIELTTRSSLEVMYLLSQMINVPSEHVCGGLVEETRNPDGSTFDWGQVLGDLFRVEVSKHRPKNAYLTVCYRGYWFYIDDADGSSKITLNLFAELFRLQRLSEAQGGPVLTLPVGR